MTVLLIILHIIVCIALIGVVLFQSGKGAEMGASFGASGSQSVFGAGGGNTFMSKVTTGAAIIFMFTSLTLAYLSGQPGTSSIMSSRGAKPAPQKQAPATQQPAPGQPQSATPPAPGAPAAQPTAPQQPAAPATPAAPAVPKK